MPDYAVMNVAEVLDHGEADQGMKVGVKVKDERGTDCVILIPHEAAGAFALRLWGGIQHAESVRRQHGRADERAAYTLPLEGIDIGRLADGSMSLRLRMKGGMKLDLPIPVEDIDRFRQAIEAVSSSDVEPPKPH